MKKVFKNKTFTSPDQSSILLNLGFDRNTADHYCIILESGYSEIKPILDNFEFDGDDIPIWSLSRLLDLIPKDFQICIKNNKIYSPEFDESFGSENSNIIDNIIEFITVLLGEDSIDKDYISTINLEYVEDLVFYDTTQVFSAISSNSHLYYIGLLQPDSTTYLIVEIPYHTLNSFKSGKIDLLSIFKDKEHYYLAEMDDNIIAKKIDKSSITEDMLPNSGFYI